MTQEELDLLNRKLDRIDRKLTVALKACHLLKVTEEEEKKIQIMQRTNLNQASKVNSELNSISNKTDENLDGVLTFNNLAEIAKDPYDGILGADILESKEVK